MGIIKGSGKSQMRPRLMFAHANEEGTGNAVQFELHPATLDRPGSMMIEFANQADAGYTDTDGYHAGGFDWQGSLKFRLKLPLIGQLLAVLDGSMEHLDADTGIVEIRRKNDTVEFGCDHEYDEDDNPQSSISLFARTSDGKSHGFFLRYEEIVVLRYAIQGSMRCLSFGNEVTE